MSEVEHTLSALLREGATPGEREVADLAQIGRFVSALLARFTAGVSLPAPPSIGLGAPLSSQRDFEQRSPILSAATADRWMSSMGVGAAMLEPRLSRPPALEVDPFAWSSLAGEAVEELPIVQLIENQLSAAAAARTTQTRRGAPRSLFGPVTARESLTFTPSASGRGDDATPVAPEVSSEPERSTTVTLADGSVMSLETVSALVSAGLSLATQPRETTHALRLDGLQVDHRTPALASALRHVAGYPAGSRPSAPQGGRRHAVGSPERMGARVTAALEPHDASMVAPVQLSGAYDSVAGDFLHVVPAATPETPETPSERASMASRQGSIFDPPASLSLSSLVQAPPGALLPMTQGVFPSPEPRPTAVVGAQHAPSGRAIPALERGPMGPPLIRAQPVPEEPAAARAPLGASSSPPETIGRLAHRSSAPSLAAPTRSESMAAEVAAGRDGGRALGERFSPVVSGATESRGDGGLDEVAWVSLSGPRSVSRDALANLPVGRALPLRPVETWSPEPGASAAVIAQSAEVREPVVGRATEQTAALERLAASARNALQRPGLTAREIQQVAPLLAALVAEPVSGEHPDVRPSLVNLLERRSTAAMGLAPERALDSGLGEALLSRAASPGAAMSPEVREAMALAGWNDAELELLSLSEPSGERPAGRRSAEEQASPALTRQLARVLTATEALSGSALSGRLDETPIGESSSRSYFEGIGPSKVTEAVALDLRQAIGELLSLAERGAGRSGDGMTEALGRLQSAEQLVATRAPVLLEPSAVDTTLVRPGRRTTLSRRVAQATARARSGPAGVDRLMRGAPVSDGGAGLEVGLSAELAPELMLPGLANPALTRQSQVADEHREVVRIVGASGAQRTETDGLAPSARSSTRLESGDEFPGRSLGASATELPSSRAWLAPGSSRPTRIRSLGGFEPELLHGVARGPRPAGPVADRQRALASFGSAWLSRVDGARTGLELGIDEEKTPFAEVFGAEPAGSGLREELDLVSPQAVTDGPSEGGGFATGQGEGASSARPRPISAASPGAGYGGSKGASLRHVEVGGRGMGPRRELDQMTARVRGTAMGGERSAMPLVANSMQAVAQSAMRSATTERAPGDRVHEERVSSATNQGAEASGDAGAQDNTLSKEAFEALAQQMADRVGRELKRERERRGQWT